MTALIWCLLAPLVVLTLCFGIEVFAGLRPLRAEDSAPKLAGDAVIVVPAHDEAAILAPNLTALKEATLGQGRILVVADNCSDRTAGIARDVGVEVIERFDLSRRGKGYALSFAREHLKGHPPAVVIIMDADCVANKTAIERLASRAAHYNRPIQSIYLQTPVPDGSPIIQVSTFAFFVRNLLRQRGLQKIAGRVHLVGTGMAFPWDLFERLSLATSNIVEDLQLGLESGYLGYPPLLAEDATVWSASATQAATVDQRRRWEGGFLQTAIWAAPPLFAKSLLRGDLRGAWAGLDLAVPPFALLILIDASAIALAGALNLWLGSSPWPAAMLLSAVFFAGLALFLGWRAGGSDFVSLRALARAPLYVIWKLPIYFRVVYQGAPKEWERTDRA